MRPKFLWLSKIIRPNPLLVAVLMVKNEEPVIQSTLQPLIDAGIDTYLIFDTGSTDNTIAVTQQFFIDHQISNFVIEQGAWIDFATSRNHALKLVHQYFPQATFMLMLDAEWHLHHGTALLNFCAQQKHSSIPLYVIRMLSHNSDFYVPRLIRCQSNVQFIGKIHEVPNVIAHHKVPETIYFELTATSYGIEKTRQRWLRDCTILHQEFEANPNDPRTVFYLAQTYHCLENFAQAKKWYQHRTTMLGWDEENFITHYRLAQVYEALGNEQQSILQYLQAFSIRPTRIEPLVQLAQYYWNKDQFDLCYLFAKRAVEIPYPQHDLLFIDKWLYDFARYDLLGRAAWYLGEYEIGKKAVQQALTVGPDYPHLHANMQLYEQQAKH